MAGKILEINLFGASWVTSVAPGRFTISGAKQKALFALLATAPFGRRTRSFLQETLWGQSCYDTGRQSLRRALADIKQAMGEAYGEVLTSTNSEVTLQLGRVKFVGDAASGVFLEGLDIREVGFQRWLNSVRDNPAQLSGLFNLASTVATDDVLPMIAVIPFRALGGDASDAALGDWLAEEVCRSLSRSRLMAVISHLSSRRLAKTAIDLSSVRDVLNADFCVWGSLRRLGDQIMADADFIDARSGRILWTRQFTGSVGDFLDRAGEGVASIVNSVGAALADEAITHVRGRVLEEIDDHRLLMAGVALMHRARLKDFARSRELIAEAARRSPRTAEVHAWLAKWHTLSVHNQWSAAVERDTALAVDAVARALDLSPDNAFGLTIDGFVQGSLLRRLDVAEVRYKAALERNPNEALAYLMKATLHTFRSEAQDALRAAENARARSPIDPFGYFYDSLIASAHVTSGAYEKALELAERSWKVNDRHLSTLRVKIIALACLQRIPEARAAVVELLRREPDFTIKTYMSRHPCAEYPIGRVVERAFRAAGVP